MRFKLIYKRVIRRISLAIVAVCVYVFVLPLFRKGGWSDTLSKNKIRFNPIPIYVIPNTNVTALKSGTLSDVRYGAEQKNRSTLSVRNILWVVMAQREDWILDLALTSLKAFDNVLVALETESPDLEIVAKTHSRTVIQYPPVCSERARKMDSDIDLCYNLHRWWSIQQGWSKNPSMLCIADGSTVIHPRLNIWLQNLPLGKSIGVRLTPNDTASAWCMGREFWERLQKASESFCTHNDSDAYGVTREVFAPSVPLSIRVGECDEVAGEKCSPQRVNEWRVVTKDWSSYTYEATALRIKWRIPHFSPTGAKKLPGDHAHCKGVCDSFLFTETTDERVFVNHVVTADVKAAIYLVEFGPACVDMTKVRVTEGGEDVKYVMGRTEEEELAKYDTGAWKIPGGIPKIDALDYQKEIFQSAVVMEQIPTEYDFKGKTVAIQRKDYANFWYNTMDLFNLYLTMLHIPSQNILWLDGHAASDLDEMWMKLFGSKPQRLGQLTGTVCYEHLVLMPKRSPMNQVDRIDGCDVDGFVRQILNAYEVTSTGEKHDTVIVRGQYLAHPRQSTGASRTFDQETLEKLKKKLPNAKFVKFQELKIGNQLQIVANTKTLYGIHGAGHTLGLFLSPGSKLVEWVVPSRRTVYTFAHMMTWRPDVAYERVSFSKWMSHTRSPSGS